MSQYVCDEVFQKFKNKVTSSLNVKNFLNART